VTDAEDMRAEIAKLRAELRAEIARNERIVTRARVLARAHRMCWPRENYKQATTGASVSVATYNAALHALLKAVNEGGER
jgi:benzoyl-CoA reductase/2-hydroxyglutaryl-CoA dehydratase subunit BcrC/BadD/HgdB